MVFSSTLQIEMLQDLTEKKKPTMSLATVNLEFKLTVNIFLKERNWVEGKFAVLASKINFHHQHMQLYFRTQR